jgi:hypothetical protein
MGAIELLEVNAGFENQQIAMCSVEGAVLSIPILAMNASGSL